MGETAIVVKGLLNFRDVGGLPTSDGGRTRFKTLYRSHSPSGLGPEGMAAIRALGLRSVLDLRDDVEREYWPYELDDPSIARLSVPVLGNQAVPPDQAGLYLHMIEACGHRFTQAVRAIAQAGTLPSLVHCAVGKDRTGVTVALALSAAGVTDDAIVGDFLRSNAGLGIPERQSGDPDNGYQTHTYVRAELIEGALAAARRLGGGVPGYLAMHGMTGAELDFLRTSLIESAQS